MSTEQQDRETRQTALTNLLLAAADLMTPRIDKTITDRVALLGTAQCMALGVVLLTAFPRYDYHAEIYVNEGSLTVWYAKPDEVTAAMLIGMTWIAPSDKPEDEGLLNGQWRFFL